ncbi:MAG: hypothetical protein LBR28_00670 [Bacteroidales bacterium]|jgi:hypothetical protein|nr:hypothetical protein [Bacteroidales bacterium]
MKRKVICSLIGLFLLSTCSIITTSCSSSNNYNDSGMPAAKYKKSQKVRTNYKVKGYGDAYYNRKKK